MGAPEPEAMRSIAAECVTLVAEESGRRLDWSIESLSELDSVCAGLLAAGPLPPQRLDLWWKLVGACTGEVVIRGYGGQWISHPQAPGAFAFSVLGGTAFPFGTAHRVLSGEPFKSLASLGRALPPSAIARTQAELRVLQRFPASAGGLPGEENPGRLSQTGQCECCAADCAGPPGAAGRVTGVRPVGTGAALPS